MKRAGLALVMLGALMGAPGLAGQEDLTDAVDAVADGTVVFQFPVADDVQVCENGVRRGEGHYYGRWRDGQDPKCEWGVAEIRLRIVDHRIRSLDLQPPTGGSVDLGMRDPQEASDFLLDLAEFDLDAEIAEDALFPGTLAQGVETWERLLYIARDRSIDNEVREQAVFWLGQAAADAATAELGEIARDNDEDKDIRESAVFALSQRPDDESVPVLMELAETAEHADVRRNALFWLAQSDDARVLDFFEEVLRGG